MLMPKTLYIVFILVFILLSSCSSQKESILVEKKGIINFLEGEIDVLISDGNNGRLEPYVFSIFKDAMPDAVIDIQDLAGDGNHYSATITSSQFAGKSKIEQHKMVYNSLKGKMGNELHALAIKTKEQ